MFISILFSSLKVDSVAAVGQELLGAGGQGGAYGTETGTHEMHMLERKDTIPNFTARWRVMREAHQAVAFGLFSCNGLMPTFISVCACVCVCFPIFYS